MIELLPSPVIVLVGGPNGAGKSTFIRQYVAVHYLEFVVLNPDEVARRLEQRGRSTAARNRSAGRETLTEITAASEALQNIILETTLSGRIYAGLIPRWQAKGYSVILHYLKLPNVEMSIERVRRRVASGGHDIPIGDLRRRFAKSLTNLEGLYKPVVDKWYVRRSEEDRFPLEDWHEGS
ncbi:MAG: zeta toxin family protein [Hyphomicrobiaceae bacterium]